MARRRLGVIFFLLNFEGRLARRRLGVFSLCSTLRVGWLGGDLGYFLMLNFEGRLARRRLGVFSLCSLRVGWLKRLGVFSFCSTMRVGWLRGTWGIFSLLNYEGRLARSDLGYFLSAQL